MRLVEFTNRDTKLLKEFVDFPYRLYKNTPQWVPPFRAAQWKLLKNGEGMQLSGGPWQLFMVLDEKDRCLARVLAGVNKVKNSQRGDNQGYFSLFECVNDEAAATLLLRGAENWLKAQGVDFFTGPVSPTNGDDGRGVLIEGAGEMPAVNTGYTMDYYAPLLEKLGYTKYLDFFAFDLIFEQAALDKVARVVEGRKGRLQLSIEPFDLKNVRAETDALADILHAAMRKEWAHLEVPTHEQVYEEFNSLRSLVDPDLVLIARVGGKPVGFVAGIPDYNQVLCHMGGKKTPLSLVKYAYYKRKISRVRMFLQFVAPQYQNTLVTAALYHELYTRYTKNGYTRMEGSTVAEYNLSSLQTLKGVGFAKTRVYRLYQKQND